MSIAPEGFTCARAGFNSAPYRFIYVRESEGTGQARAVLSQHYPKSQIVSVIVWTGADATNALERLGKVMQRKSVLESLREFWQVYAHTAIPLHSF